MREIKFRAWDPSRHEMVYGPYHFELTSGEYVYFEDFRAVEDGRYRSCKLMEYTGIKDKNDVEIYEGDILAGVNGSINRIPWPWGNCLVKYENGSHDVPEWGYPENSDNTHWIEVIGNVHENPELLEAS